MTSQKLTLGQYEFQAVGQIEPTFMRPGAIGKLLGVGRSVVTNWGSYGAIPYYCRGTLTGVVGKTDLWSIVDELNRPDPVQIKANILGSYTAWGQVLSFVPVEKPGYNQDGISYTYDFDIVFIQAMRSDQGSRGVQHNTVQENDTFNLDGDPVVPLPVNATSPSETVDFTRYVDDGAGGTLAIPCVLTPDLTSITYVATEANMPKAVVTLSRSGRELKLSNSSIYLQSCHDEASNKGYVEVWYYNGTTWVHVANLRGSIMKTAGSLQGFTASSKGPEMWPIFPGDRYRQGLRLLYPATVTDSLVGVMEFEMEYGRPGFKWYIENGGATDLVKARYQVDLLPTDFRYWTRNGTERDANAGAYGTETQAGDTDTVNVEWVQTTTGAPAASSILLTIARRKKVDADEVATDAGAYWSMIAQDFDNVTRKTGYKFEPVWMSVGRYDKIGSRTAAQLASENLARVTVDHTIIPNTY